MRDLWMDRLSDYLDDDMPRSEAVDLEAHLATCDACRATLDELRRVKEQASSLVDPPVPDDLWAGIATRIGAAGSTSDEAPVRPAARVVALPTHRHWTLTWPQLAAAGFLLMVGSAALFWSLRGTVDQRTLAQRTPTTAESTGGAPVSASAAGFDAHEVEGEIAQLQKALDAGRDRLDPQTVKVLERNLALIRTATTEASRALAADPANADLQQYLAGTVRRKLDLMKRATALAGI